MLVFVAEDPEEAAARSSLSMRLRHGVCIHRSLYDLNRLFSRAVLEGHVRPYLNALLRPSLAVLEGHFRREATARIHVRSLPLATIWLGTLEVLTL